MSMVINLPKRRHCKSCGKLYSPAFLQQWWCCDECRDAVIKMAAEKGRQSVARKKAAALKEERKVWRERKAAIKPLKHWEDMTQRVVNDYITKGRDADKPCVSCGTWVTVQWEAGHYRSRGAASHLRYNEDNLAKQCHRCNCELSSNAIQYREGLIARIGIKRVLALENDNTPHRYTREELDGIRAHYRAKLRELLKQREAA